MCIPGGQRSSRQAALPAAAAISIAFFLLFSLLTARDGSAQISANGAGSVDQTGTVRAATAPPGSSPDSQDSELVLILDLDGDTISDSFVAVERSGRIYLPVCAVAEAVSLAINCVEDRAYGFILSESRPIVIDLKEGFTISGRSASKIHGTVFMHGSELFADLAELSKWLPIDFHYREEISTVKMSPREMLPAQGFKKRQKFRNPPAPVPARQFDDFTPTRGAASVPTVDLTSQLSRSVDGHGGGKNTLLNVLGMSGDLLYMSSEVHLYTENDALKRFDLALFRRSESGFKVGPVPVTQLVFGTAQAPTVDGIGAATTPMYGMLLSNRPLSGASQFLSHDLDGYLPAGWDAELFHNGSPIGYQPPSQDGMYHFRNLSVQYGINQFKVILHGPFGETRESEQTFFSDATTPSGKLLYTLSGAWQTGLTPGEAGGAGRASNLTLASDFGVSQQLAGSTLLVRQAESSGAEQYYAGLGLRTALGYTLISLDLIQSFVPASGTGGELLSVRTSSRDVLGSAIQVEQRLFRDFYSLRFPKTADPLLSQTLVKCSNSLPGWDDIRLPLYAEIDLDIKRSGTADWATVWRVTGGWHGWNGALEADVADLQRTLTATGVLQISTKLKGVSVRGQAGLSVAPELTPSAINLSADKELGGGFQLNSGLMHDPVGKTTEGRIGLSKRFGLVGYAISATGSRTGGYSVNLGVSSSFAADRFNGQAVISAEALTPSGMIALSAQTAGG